MRLSLGRPGKREIADCARRHSNNTTKWRPLKYGAYKFKEVRRFCDAIFLFIGVFGQMIHESISTISEDFRYDNGQPKYHVIFM